MLEFIRRFFDKGLLGGQRSSQWPQIRKEFLKHNDTCAACGRKKGLLKPLEVHHVIPYHKSKSLELKKTNLIVLCKEHHFFCGHLMDWQSWNEDVRFDCAEWKDKINRRP